MSGVREGPDGETHYWDSGFMMPLCMAMLTHSAERPGSPVTCVLCNTRVLYEIGAGSDGLIHTVRNTGDREVLCGHNDYDLLVEGTVNCIGCLAGVR